MIFISWHSATKKKKKNKGGMWWQKENHCLSVWKTFSTELFLLDKNSDLILRRKHGGLGLRMSLKRANVFYNKISNFSDSHPGESDWVILKFVKSRGGGTEKSQTCILDFSNSIFERTLRESRSDPMAWNPERRKCPRRIGNSLKWDTEIRNNRPMNEKLEKSKKTKMDISKAL